MRVGVVQGTPWLADPVVERWSFRFSLGVAGIYTMIPLFFVRSFVHGSMKDRHFHVGRGADPSALPTKMETEEACECNQ